MGLVLKRVKEAVELVATWLAARSPRQVLAFGFVVFVLYGFPGLMSTDSWAQLQEARLLTFTDGHPPFMAAEWSLLDRIVRGPLLMLLLQGAVFLLGARMIFARLFGPRGAAWAAIGLLLFPPVLTCMAVIWKDSQMAAYLLLGIGLVMHSRLRIRLIGVALLVVAALLRHNAIVAVLPIVVMLFEWRPGMRLLRRLALLGAAAVVVIGLTFGISRMLTSSHVRLTPAFSDIIGVLAFTEPRTDDDLKHLLRGTPLVVDHGIQLQAILLYTQRGAFRITQGEDRFFAYPKTDDEWRNLNRVWFELIRDDPWAYASYHWDTFSRVIGTSERPRAFIWTGFVEYPPQVEPIEHQASASRFQNWAWARLFWLADHTAIFVPYYYLAIAILLLVFVSRDRFTAALLISGLLYELSFLPAAAEPDYRYSHWAITSTCIAAIFLFVQRYRRGRA